MTYFVGLLVFICRVVVVICRVVVVLSFLCVLVSIEMWSCLRIEVLVQGFGGGGGVWVGGGKGDKVLVWER